MYPRANVLDIVTRNKEARKKNLESNQKEQVLITD